MSSHSEKKIFKKVFSLHVQITCLQLSWCFLRVQLQIIPEVIMRGRGGGGRRGGRRPVLPRYFSPFVNNGDVNCRRFDRAFERAVTTATVTFTRDISRSLRLPPFKTLMNGTSCRVEEKRETWVIQGNMDKHSVRIELSFEGGPVLGLPLFGRVNSFAKEDMRKKRHNFVVDFRIIWHLSSGYVFTFFWETSHLFLCLHEVLFSKY